MKLFLPARRTLLGGDLSEAPHADDVAVVAFVDRTFPHVEANGTFEGGDIVMFYVVICGCRLHNCHCCFCMFFQIRVVLIRSRCEGAAVGEGEEIRSLYM